MMPTAPTVHPTAMPTMAAVDSPLAALEHWETVTVNVVLEYCGVPKHSSGFEDIASIAANWPEMPPEACAMI